MTLTRRTVQAHVPALHGTQRGKVKFVVTDCKTDFPVGGAAGSFMSIHDRPTEQCHCVGPTE